MIRTLTLLVLAASFAGASHRPVAPDEFGALKALPTPAGPGSAEPNLALGPGGHVYLSWIELAPDSGHALRFARLDQERFGPARLIARGNRGDWFVNWADFPSILAVSDKLLVAHWLERRGMDVVRKIHASRVEEQTLAPSIRILRVTRK